MKMLLKQKATVVLPDSNNARISPCVTKAGQKNNSLISDNVDLSDLEL